MVDPAVIGRFLGKIFEFTDEGVVSLLGIGEKGTAQEGVYKKRIFTSQDQGSVIVDQVARWADMGVAAFFVPAVIKPSAVIAGDVKEDKIAAFTSIVLDIDTGDVPEKARYAACALGTPSMVVLSGGKTETGNTKKHLYWCLDEPTDEVARVGRLRKMLAAKVGGDQSFGRVTQVIRIAGSVHCKNGVASPVKLDHCSDATYSLEDLAEAIEAMQPMDGCQAPQSTLPALAAQGGMMDFSPRQDTALAAMHRDVHEGGVDGQTRWDQFNKVAGFAIREAREGRMTPAEAVAHAQGWMLSHMVPPWPEARFQQEFAGLWGADIKANGAMQAPAAPAISLTVGRVIEPSPAPWIAENLIPPRPFLFGHLLMRGKIATFTAPGGVGKSSWVATAMLSLASGKPLLGKEVWGKPKTVWGLSLEDDGVDIARSLTAAAKHHGITQQECGGRIFVDSGPDGVTICLAYDDRIGFHLNDIDYDALEAAIVSRGVDVLFIDPIVSAHSIDENDNGKVDAMIKRLAGIARRTGCAMGLIHHSRKLHGERVTADSSRGAGAMNNAARMAIVFNRMTFDQAETWGIEPWAAAQYFSVGDDKHNLTAPEAADWYRLESVTLNNAADPYPADSVGVVARWQPPRAMDGVLAEHVIEFQQELKRFEAAGKHYWRNIRTGKQWAGDLVGRILKFDTSTATPGRKKADQILAAWQKSGLIKVEQRKNTRNINEGGDDNEKPAVIVGHAVGQVQFTSEMTTERNQDG